MTNRLRFGIFMPPFNAPATQNPTTSLQRNVDTIRLLDDLGYDEAWVGEHHSAGTEIIAEPIQFITYVGALTKHIKLGPGVVSLPYHNPLWVADRIILADHLLRGRVMLGLGPGSLPTDAAMVGLKPSDLRPALEHDTPILLKLIRGEEPVSVVTDRYRLVEARTQLAPFQDPCFDIAVAASASPAGPRLAGRYGLGLLSLGILITDKLDALHLHWNVLEEEAAKYGKVPDRNRWRLVGFMHLAETKKQAIEDLRYGLDAFVEYTQKTLALPAIRVRGDTFEERVEHYLQSNQAVIGTPDEAVAFLKKLQEQSGGFGCYLQVATDWCNWEATKKSYELFARHVIPYFQPSQRRLLDSEAYAQSRLAELDLANANAVKTWTEKHHAEKKGDA
jgi:limonene 1,2-monooxygenase